MDGQEIITSAKYPNHMYHDHKDLPCLLITNKTESIIVPDNIMKSVKNYSRYLSKCYFNNGACIVIDDNLDKKGLMFMLDAILVIHYAGSPLTNYDISNQQFRYIVAKYDLGMEQQEIGTCSNDFSDCEDLPSLENISDNECPCEHFSDSDDE